jgi:hypothetical protein
MTLLGKLKLGFRVLVLAVVMLMALNIGELIWIDRWQGDTSQTVANSLAAVQLTKSVDSMVSTIGDMSVTLQDGGNPLSLESAFSANSNESTAAVDSILTSGVLSREERTAVQTLKTQLDEYIQAGSALLTKSGVDSSNVLTKSLPVKGQGRDMLNATRAYQDAAQLPIAARMDRLGLVGMICLTVTGVLGGVAVIAGLLVSWRTPRAIGRTLNEAATGISGSAAELMAIASQVSASAAQTAASTNETTVTVEEVKQTAMLTNEKAGQVVESTDGAARVIEAGLSQVEGTIAGIERMRNSMDVVFETISRLSERALAAGDVVAAVNDLAEQSNLLSVNASIEAAKAGEYGKGFTVVAQEVKSLAEQSKQAVSQVRTILGEIQKASETAVRAAEQGRDSVEAGRRQSVEAGEVIQSLAEGASEVAQSAVQISASSRQQLAGMEQISQAISSINEAGTQSVGGTRQVEQEVRHLQDLALRLKKLVQIELPEASE